METVSQSMRLFISLPVPEEMRVKIDPILAQLEEFKELKCVEHKNLHFTLFFLGECDDKQLEKVKKVLSKIQVSKFTVRVAGVGTFPQRNWPPKVIWIAGHSPELVALQGKIATDMELLGFTPNPDYTPHLTLARVKQDIKSKKRLGDIIQSLESVDLGSFEAKHFDIMESSLGPRGPTYTVKEVYRLS
jgi:RNA 2',3'-cyclic 3'-phosphodiesterase